MCKSSLVETRPRCGAAVARFPSVVRFSARFLLIKIACLREGILFIYVGRVRSRHDGHSQGSKYVGYRHSSPDASVPLAVLISPGPHPTHPFRQPLCVLLVHTDSFLNFTRCVYLLCWRTIAINIGAISRTQCEMSQYKLVNQHI